MRLLIEPTEAFVDIAGRASLRARVWRATAPDGTVLQVFVAEVALAAHAPFNEELARALGGPFAIPISDASPSAAPLVSPRDSLSAPSGRGAGAPEPAEIYLYPHGHPASAAAANTVDVLQPSLEWLADRVGIKAVLDALATLYLHWVVRHYGADLARVHLERMREAVDQIAAGVADPRIANAAQGRA